MRNALRKKFGDVAHDPVHAEAQHLSELKKGQKYLDYETRKATVEKNIKLAMQLLGYTVGGSVILKGLGHFAE